MLTDEQRRDGAARLIAAERDKVAVEQLSITFPNIELEDAYAIQMMWESGGPPQEPGSWAT